MKQVLFRLLRRVGFIVNIARQKFEFGSGKSQLKISKQNLQKQSWKVTNIFLPWWMSFLVLVSKAQIVVFHENDFLRIRLISFVGCCLAAFPPDIEPSFIFRKSLLLADRRDCFCLTRRNNAQQQRRRAAALTASALLPPGPSNGPLTQVEAKLGALFQTRRTGGQRKNAGLPTLTPTT